ncbi:14-3-3-like protein, partial [Auxenochlorella protothecoides]
GMVDSE